MGEDSWLYRYCKRMRMRIGIGIGIGMDLGDVLLWIWDAILGTL